MNHCYSGKLRHWQKVFRKKDSSQAQLESLGSLEHSRALPSAKPDSGEAKMLREWENLKTYIGLDTVGSRVTAFAR